MTAATEAPAVSFTLLDDARFDAQLDAERCPLLSYEPDEDNPFTCLGLLVDDQDQAARFIDRVARLDPGAGLVLAERVQTRMVGEGLVVFWPGIPSPIDRANETAEAGV